MTFVSYQKQQQQQQQQQTSGHRSVPTT